MSSTVHCDACGKPGLRAIGACAPAGWRFAEVKIVDENGTRVDADTVIVWACSPECGERFWLRGPGVLNLETGEATGS